MIFTKPAAEGSSGSIARSFIKNIFISIYLDI